MTIVKEYIGEGVFSYRAGIQEFLIPGQRVVDKTNIEKLAINNGYEKVFTVEKPWKDECIFESAPQDNCPHRPKPIEKSSCVCDSVYYHKTL